MDRQIQILDFIIRDYIKHGCPVSSGRVHEGLKLDAAPATIRNIMLELDVDGFLKQPHTSGGRVPTEKAYRYFVNSLMKIKKPPKKDRDMFEEFLRNISSDGEESDLGREIAERIGLFTVFADFGGKKRIRQYGLSRILDEPEFFVRDALSDFGKISDEWYEVIDAYRQSMRRAEEVFIGSENPLKETKFFSVIGGRAKRRGEDIVVLSFGPQRMNYEHGCSIFHYFLENNADDHDR